MFAYKAAVAVKNLGFKHIKIYNGGLKDWKKSGFRTVSIEPLPEYACRFIDAQALLEKIQQGGAECLNDAGQPGATIVDFRTEPFLNTGTSVPYIRTACPVVYCLLDDLKKPEVRHRIPRTGFVVMVSETGNRDRAAIRYLSRYGYTNIVGLRYGMRDWLKSGYPVDYLKGKPLQ